MPRGSLVISQTDHCRRRQARKVGAPRGGCDVDVARWRHRQIVQLDGEPADHDECHPMPFERGQQSIDVDVGRRHSPTPHPAKSGRLGAVD
jgi:hypothetical protein